MSVNRIVATIVGYCFYLPMWLIGWVRAPLEQRQGGRRSRFGDLLLCERAQRWQGGSLFRSAADRSMHALAFSTFRVQSVLVFQPKKQRKDD